MKDAWTARQEGSSENEIYKEIEKHMEIQYNLYKNGSEMDRDAALRMAAYWKQTNFIH
ncbi:hypothetical protein L3476_06295 [Paenibacillus thiaminolyticus]|uniref:hypothetical protein n=1 Tax=Paenibacillus thiaminolyticus TaxID=49283 RepID=UPI0023505641|nr:hypothetical protein [Paenibacillus thiaminolyticus]WCR28351.1 hypothetical protein L3476_06295 [Paenibacillus thiaminolyticus]